MKKTILERFISKYNLGGSVDSLLWKADKKGISTKFMSDDKHCIGEISTTELKLTDGDYPIYETGVLKSLLTVLNDELDVKVQTNVSGKNSSLVFSDGDVKTTFVLSNESNIPTPPTIKHIPKFEFSILIDKNFSERFVRAKSSLADSETFAVTSDGKTVNLILGYSDNNTNRVSIKVTPIEDEIEKIDPVHFHARYLKEILSANKEAESGKLEISSEGLSRITFKQDGFNVLYYLPSVKVD